MHRSDGKNDRAQLRNHQRRRDEGLILLVHINLQDHN